MKEGIPGKNYEYINLEGREKRALLGVCNKLSKTGI